MIDRKSIIAWSEQFPWSDPSMVEQDLLISRALVAIFSDEFLVSQLAFRGKPFYDQVLGMMLNRLTRSFIRPS